MAKSSLKTANGHAGKNRISEMMDSAPTAVTISPPNIKTVHFTLVGTSPYVQNKFSAKAKQQIKDKQEAGGTAKTGLRKPKDFQDAYEGAKYKPTGENWPNGAIPATSIKAAMVAACRNVGFKMTEAKQCVYVEQDGFDMEERIPLIKITKGKPVYFEQALSPSSGGRDIRPRPLWEAGWEAVVRITFDADRFTVSDVANLLLRAGCQVGIGEGRPASKMSCGLGWGCFRIKE